MPLAVFLDGPMDGQELEVEPRTQIVFPEVEISTVYHRGDEHTVPASRVKRHIYGLQTKDRLEAIKLSPLPSHIKVQRSKAVLLYGYEGRDA